MDGSYEFLDNWNMKAVPTYFLYGELEEHLGPESLHCETIAERSAPHHWVIKPHRHAAFVQLLFINSGGGDAVLGEDRVPLRPPSAVLIPPGTVHGFRFSGDVTGHVVTLRAERLSSLLGSSPEVRRTLEQPRVMPLGNAGEAAAICREHCAAIAEEYASRGIGRAAVMEAHLLALLVWLCRAAGVLAEHPARGRAPRLARAFQALVDAHYRQHEPLLFYARRLGVTPTHLNRVARAVLGDSALGTIHRRLVLEARRELTFTAKPVSEIAQSLGFRDAAYFTRFFTKAEGVSPRGFRARVAAGR